MNVDKIEITKKELFLDEVSKNEAMKSLEDIIYLVNNGEKVGASEVIKVLRYAKARLLKEPKTKIAKTVKQWLSVASAKKKSGRPVLEGVYYDRVEDRTVATDVRRLHLSKGDVLGLKDTENNFLSVDGEWQKEEGYPEYGMVIPADNVLSSAVVIKKELIPHKTPVYKLLMKCTENGKEYVVVVNARYYDETVGFFEGEYSLRIREKTEKLEDGTRLLVYPLVFSKGPLLALVMPMRFPCSEV